MPDSHLSKSQFQESVKLDIVVCVRQKIVNLIPFPSSPELIKLDLISGFYCVLVDESIQLRLDRIIIIHLLYSQVHNKWGGGQIKWGGGAFKDFEKLLNRGEQNK